MLESILPTIRPGVLRDDESNGEGLMSEFRGRNPNFSDGDTLKPDGIFEKFPWKEAESRDLKSLNSEKSIVDH